MNDDDVTALLMNHEESLESMFTVLNNAVHKLEQLQSELEAIEKRINEATDNNED